MGRGIWVGRAVTHIKPMLGSWTDLHAPSIQTACNIYANILP